eukprot:GHVP01042814.1.p1 GENE.GHVP01042814.1~~GHVP01042814.1.p1  ORF type:complete len:319 (+),score=54.65 GHVP01042814.1:26-958(+)
MEERRYNFLQKYILQKENPEDIREGALKVLSEHVYSFIKQQHSIIESQVIETCGIKVSNIGEAETLNNLLAKFINKEKIYFLAKQAIEAWHQQKTFETMFDFSPSQVGETPDRIEETKTRLGYHMCDSCQAINRSHDSKLRKNAYTSLNILQESFGGIDEKNPSEKEYQIALNDSIRHILRAQDDITIRNFLIIGSLEIDVAIEKNDDITCIMELKRDECLNLDVAILQACLYGIKVACHRKRSESKLNILAISMSGRKALIGNFHFRLDHETKSIIESSIKVYKKAIYLNNKKDLFLMAKHMLNEGIIQ